jgi:hypothetical protein
MTARRPGRVETALNHELRAETAVPIGGRAHLRATAELVDLAVGKADLDAGAKCVRAYLEIRQAYGLAGNVAEPLDPFAAFVAGLSAPVTRHGEDD